MLGCPVGVICVGGANSLNGSLVVGGVDGPGALCALVFQGKSGGTSELVMRSVKLTNFNHEQIKTESKSAKATVK